MSILRSFYDEQRFVTKKTIIELKSIHGLDRRRDIWAGDVGSNGSEFVLTATTGAPATLSTAERGPYPPGQQVEAGTAYRLSYRPAVGEVHKFGYYDDEDGFYFEFDHDGFNLVLRRAGDADSRVQWGKWKGDRILRNGLSTQSFRPADGHVFQINFTWYGHGPIEYSFQVVRRVLGSWLSILEEKRPLGVTSITQPHLPVRAEVFSSGTEAFGYLGGRQVSVVGNYDPISRQTSIETGDITITSDTVWQPVLAVRRRVLKPYALTQFAELMVLASNDVRFAVLLDPTIVNAGNWNVNGVTDYGLNTTRLQENLNPGAIDITTGVMGKKTRVSGTGQGNRSEGAPVDFDRQPLLELQPMVLVACNRVGGANATVSVTATFREDF